MSALITVSVHDMTDVDLIISQLETSQYKAALALIDTLLTELKRLDDKMILTEVHLLESRVYRGIGNLAKAKVCSVDLKNINKFSNWSYTGSFDFREDSGELNLLPTTPPSPARLTVGYFARRG